MSAGDERLRAPAPQARCPICGKPADREGPARPFCSTRCQMVDLNRWLRGDYRIPGEPVEPGAPGSEGLPDPSDDAPPTDRR